MPKCIGLMSGTSMDGVDAVLCEIEPASGATRIEAHARVGYGPSLRERLLALQVDPDHALTLRELSSLDHDVGLTFAQAASALIAKVGIGLDTIEVIGSHGQTVFHDPAVSRNTLQLGDPGLIAAKCGVAVVADFRRGDLAHGGEGAPLVPGFHRACFSAQAPCVVLNLGGIANVTLLAADGHTSGFDTGPANGLMDMWISTHRGCMFDHGGEWARSGKVSDELLRACLADDYFSRPPPKSTGRDYFNLTWLRRRYPQLSELPPADVQRTLCELTAASIAESLHLHAPDSAHLYVCGGGRRNRMLIEALRARVPQAQLDLTDSLGIDGDLVEAAAFAWLGWRRIALLPGNVPAVTGAARDVVLGGLYLP